MPNNPKQRNPNRYEAIILRLFEDRHGRQFVVPVQAKGGNDRHGVVQTHQDSTYCLGKFPNLICRAVSAQFMTEDRIAMFELTIQDALVKVVDEKYYQLVSCTDISTDDIRNYQLWNRSSGA